ncbi:MAG: dihydroneopterin aldolase [Ignavibacteriales bacterium CG_4_9_14_3_um_filter_30_11]|nr:MAG: dihydroneopterin aldolase [Ignavibacteriales bacterium CG_4_9_14_3_um_filter_30_11]
MENIIRIKKAVFYGYHGVRSEEQSVGSQYEADVDIYTDFRYTSKSDNLNDTIDYQRVYQFMNKLALERKYYLIESVALIIADQLLINFPRIIKVCVRVRKENPPLGGVVDSVEVEVVKTRDELETKNV